MRTKNILGLMTAALFVLLGTAPSHAQRITEDALPATTPKLNANQAPAKAPTVTHDYDWYAAKTYTWTDASGATHEASMVDEVTNPYQMYDLLKWVYCNPEIPGIKTTAVTGGNVYYGEQYLIDREWNFLWWDYFHVDPGWGITNDNVTAPNEDGHTLFLIKVKNYSDQPGEYTSTKADIIDYFSKYIESVRLLTDGMRGGEGNNVGTMFNISGTFNRFYIIGKGKSYYWEPQYNSDSPPLAPFYNMFEEYSPTTTNTGAQITDFYESMNDGESYPVIHDCGSVTYFKHFFSMSGNNGTEEKSMNSMVFFIPDNRNKYNNRNYDVNHQPYVGLYVIQLDATAAPAEAEKTYDVTLNWTSTLDELARSEVPQTYNIYIVTTDEQGNQSYDLLATTSETTYTYQVPQEDHSYTIHYVIHGMATENSAFETWSNIDDVIIPGLNDFLGLDLDHSESDYVSAEELNYYRNFLTVQNEDMLNALTVARINAGENNFTLYRFDAALPDVMLPVAQMTLTANGNTVTYEITYENQEPLAGYSVPITLTGNLPVGANGIVDLTPITFVDQFNASTAENLHPVEYGYLLALQPDNNKTSNTVHVSVPKTESTIDGFYTLDEVMNDVDAELPANVKNANVKMSLVNNPAIYYYTLERGDNVAPNDAISKLQRMNNGKFIEGLDRLGHEGEIYDEGAFNLLDNDMLYGIPGDFVSYVPVIWTFGTKRVNHDGENSYGSPIWKTGVGTVSGVIDGYCTYGENGIWRDENGAICRIYYPTINADGFLPEGASVEYEPVMFRVWRICDGIRGFIRQDDWKPVNDVTADRDPHKLIIEEIGDKLTLEVGGDYQTNPIGFGALRDTEIKFLVRFYYKKVDDGRDGEPMYYVVETSMLWDEIPTSVAEISAMSEVSKTYINAQGMQSDKPFDGMNIVITRYSDGSTRTTKVVR